MLSWLVIVVLSLLLLISTSMLLFIYFDVKRMTEQLDRIIEDFGTNETLRTNTHHRVMNRFIMKINQLIQLFKKDQQYQEKRERRLKQEITNISHDLRTPLTSIKGFSQLLLDEQITETDKKQYIQT